MKKKLMNISLNRYNSHELTLFSNKTKFLLKSGLILLFVLHFCISTTFAQQTAPVSPPTGGFHIEGNLRANTPTANIGDWLTGTGGSGGFVLTDAGVPVDATKTYHVIDLFNSSTDITFTGSKGNANPNDPLKYKWTATNVSNKTDINNALLHITKDPSNNHIWAMFAGDRLATNGTTYIDFEFLQNTLVRRTPDADPRYFASSGPDGGRTVNDLNLTVEYTGGGSIANIVYYTWQPVAGGGFDYVQFTPSMAPPTGFAFTSGGGESVPYSAFGNTTYIANQFVEGAVDLDALVSSSVNICAGLIIKTVFIKTKASAAISANLEDLVEPIQLQLGIGLNATTTASAILCNGGSSTLTTIATGGTSPYMYSLNGGPFQPGNTFIVSAGLSYIVTIKDANGCTKAAAPVAVTQPDVLVIGTPNVTNVSCNGGSNGAIDITPSGGTAPYTYDWDNDGAETPDNDPQDLSGLAAGTYTVTVTDANGCTTTASATITQPAAALAATETHVNVLCFGGTTGSIDLSVTGGTAPYTYDWDNDGAETPDNDPQDLSGLAAGTYTVTVTDANGCTTTASVTIEQPAFPLSEVTCGKVEIDCKNPLLGGSVIASTFKYAVGTVTYSWANAAGVVVGTTPIVSGLPAGTYTLTLKDDCFTRNCTVTIAPSKCSHLFPTSTSCCTYSNGTALELPELCYAAKTSGTVSNATPGVFFYYAKVVAPSTDFTVEVLQSVVQPNITSIFKLFNIQQSNQIILWGPNCEKVATGFEIGTSGQGTVPVKNAVKGETYVISVKYDTKTMIGSIYTTAFMPDVKYTFKSIVKVGFGDPGSPVPFSEGSILARDCKSTFVSPGTCPPPVQPLMTNNNKSQYKVFENKLSVIPNPATSLVQLSFNAELDSRSAIIISDMNGKTLRKIDYQAVIGLNTTSVNLDDLANGVYIITVKTNNQQLAERLVIMK